MLPMGSNLPYVSVVKIYPHSKFSVEEKRRIMFAVIGNYANQLVVRAVSVIAVERSVEHVR